MTGGLPIALEYHELQGGIVQGTILDATPGRPRAAVTSQITGVAPEVGREIARRWNAHTDLVAACEALVALFTGPGDGHDAECPLCESIGPGDCETPECPVVLARGALAKAGRR